jgi:outer membrane protein TolC
MASGCASTGGPSLPPLQSSNAAFDRATAEALQEDAAKLVLSWLEPRPVDLSKALDPDAIAQIAVIANPDLRALRKQAQIADAQVFAAGLLPDPSFSFGIDVVVSGPVTTLANALAGSLSQDFASVRTRAATVAQAEAQARTVRLDLAWVEWQTAAQARLIASQIVAGERQLALLRDIERVSRELFDRTRLAAGRGDIGGDQLQSARIADLDATAQLRVAELAFAQSRQDLVKLLGLPPQTEIRLIAGPPSEPALDCERLSGLAAERTDIAALRAGYEAQDAAVRIAKLSAFPAPNLTINGSRNESGNRFVGPAIGVALPLWNRRRGSIMVAEATGAALQAQYDARLFQARADIATLCSLHGIAGRQIDSARSQLPALEQFAVASSRASQRGDLAQSVADNAMLTIWSKSLQIDQLEQSQIERLIGLEMAVGRKVEAWKSGRQQE